tara:strand:- start:4943 stop:7915 length:2973 start_codon:yes stop_codon:yes gene_type:complete
MVYNRNRGFIGTAKNISPTETDGRLEIQDVYHATLDNQYPVFTEGEVVFTVEQAYASGNNTGSIQRVDTGSTANATHVNYYWTCPDDVHQVSIVAIGGGASGLSVPNSPYTYDLDHKVRIAGGGGGALAYSNNMPVSGGKTYLIQVGKGGGYNVDAKGVVYATSVGTMTTTSSSNGVLSNQTPNDGGGSGQFLGIDGGDSGIRNGTSDASFLIKAGGGFVVKNIRENAKTVGYNYRNNATYGNYRWGINLDSSSGGATSAPYEIDPSIINISGGGYGGEGGGGDPKVPNISSSDYDFGEIASEICGGGGAGGYGTDGVTNHYITIIKVAVGYGKFYFKRTEGITEGASQNFSSMPTANYWNDSSWSANGVNLLSNGTIVFDWSDDSFTNGNHLIRIGYNREGTSSGGTAGDREISTTAGTILGVHDAVDDSSPMDRFVNIRDYTVDTTNKRTILNFAQTNINTIFYLYCPNHTGMGFPILMQNRNTYNNRFDDEVGGYQYYFKGNGQGGHGGGHTHIGGNYSMTGSYNYSWEHILMFPHFGLSGGGGGGASLAITDRTYTQHWFGQAIEGASANGVSTFPTANSALLAGGGGGTSIFGLDTTVNEATADIIQKCLEYSDWNLTSQYGNTTVPTNIGRTNGSAGMTLFTGNTFDASASDTIMLGRMAKAGIDGSVQGVHLLGTHGGDAFPRNSYKPTTYASTEQNFYYVGSVEGRGQSGTSVTTDQNWQTFSYTTYQYRVSGTTPVGSSASLLSIGSVYYYVLFVYRNGTTGSNYWKGDIQIDNVRPYHTSDSAGTNVVQDFSHTFDTSVSSYQRNNDSIHSTQSFSTTNYNNMTWATVGTGTSGGVWNRDNNGTPSNTTGSNVDGSGNAGSQYAGWYLYAETSSGYDVYGRYYWLRSYQQNLSHSSRFLKQLDVDIARIGDNVGKIDIYIVTGYEGQDTSGIPDNARKGACGGMFGGGGGGALNRRGGDGQNGAVRIIWGSNRNFPYNAR